MSNLNKFLILESEDVRANIDEVKKFVSIYPLDIRYASEDLKNNKELAKFVMEVNQDSYEFLGEEIKKDKDIAYLAFKKSKSLIKFFPEELLQNKFFAMKLIEIDPFVIEDLSEKLMNDEDVMKACLSKEPRLLKFNKVKSLENDESFWLEQVKKNADNLFFIPLNLQINSEFREKAINQANVESLDVHLYKLDKDSLVLNILEKRRDLFPLVSNKFKTSDFSLPFVKLDISNINHVPLDLLTNKEFIAEVYKLDPTFSTVLSKENSKNPQLKTILKEVVTNYKKENKKVI